MVLSAARPTQHPKTRIYQFRKVVPERLRDLIGKREVKVSLGTRDPAVARRLHAEVSAQVDADWAERERAAMKGDVPPMRLMHEHVVGLSGCLYRELMDRHGDDPGSRNTWIDKLERAHPALPHDRRVPSSIFGPPGWAGSASATAQRLVGGKVQELLDAQGLHVDWESRNRLNLAGAVAVAQAYRELAKRAGGDFSADPEANRFPPLLSTPSRGAKTPVPWRGIHEAYLREMKPAA